MDKALVKELNNQITKEFYSSYLYLSMAAYFNSETLDGFAHWMRIQAQEELTHGMKIFDYLTERGETITLSQIDKPPVSFSSVEDVFKKSLAHEKTVTESINNLYNLSNRVNDNACSIFLQWFINEQVEEEKNANDILGKLKYVKSEPAGILLLDKDLSQRILPVFDQKKQ
ncbi:MAG: ferritin [Candidatus Omnitrophica bacterium]|nr:ferritin [Candidatus Omnitrophota bacterium]